MIPLKDAFKDIRFGWIWLVCSFLSIISAGYSQPWQQNDLIFNPSGIPSLSFSQPRFADIDADGDYDLILGNIDGYPYYFYNSGTPANPAYQAGLAIFSSVSSLDAEMARLLSARPPDSMTEMYRYGDDHEARYYAFFAQSIWRRTPGALKWLKTCTARENL